MSQNKQLVDYGIQTEDSDIRVHVCPRARRVYVYPTACGLAAIATGKYRAVKGYQKGFGFPTATGYPIPPFDIPRCSSITIRNCAWEEMAFQDEDTTTAKGEKAQRLTLGMLRAGLLPIPALGEEIDEKDIQIKGQDIIIRNGAITNKDIRIQVKCDYPGGEKELGGTGNLFLQVQECNPGNYH